MEQEQCITDNACWFVKLDVEAQRSIANEAKVVRFIDVLKFMMQISTSVVSFSNWLTQVYIYLGILRITHKDFFWGSAGDGWEGNIDICSHGKENSNGSMLMATINFDIGVGNAHVARHGLDLLTRNTTKGIIVQCHSSPLANCFCLSSLYKNIEVYCY